MYRENIILNRFHEDYKIKARCCSMACNVL